MVTMAAVKKRASWAEYVQRVISGMSIKAVAKAAGVHETRIYDWLKDQPAKAESAVSFARSLNESPVEALIAAGFLEPEEAEGFVEVYRSREELTDDELVAELAKRLEERSGAKVDDITHRLARPGDTD